MVANYAAAGFATYLFLSSVLGPSIGEGPAKILGIGVGLGVQGFRAVIVYFDLLTPNRLSFDKRPELIALAFTIFTCIEIYLLGMDMNIHISAIVSLSGLQVAGYLAEINLLNQFRYIINYHLSTNPDKVKELVTAHTNAANLEAYLDKVEEAMKEKGQYIKAPDLSRFMLGDEYTPTPPASTTKAKAKPEQPDREMYPDGYDFPQYQYPNGTTGPALPKHYDLDFTAGN